MNKNTKFSEKAQYVTPSSKAVELELNAIICTSDPMRAGQLPDSEEENWGRF